MSPFYSCWCLESTDFWKAERYFASVSYIRREVEVSWLVIYNCIRVQRSLQSPGIATCRCVLFIQCWERKTPPIYFKSLLVLKILRKLGELSLRISQEVCRWRNRSFASTTRLTNTEENTCSFASVMVSHTATLRIVRSSLDTILPCILWPWYRVQTPFHLTLLAAWSLLITKDLLRRGTAAQGSRGPQKSWNRRVEASQSYLRIVL